MTNEQKAKAKRMRVLRCKIVAVARFSRMILVLRKCEKEITKIKTMTKSGKLPLMTLIGGSSGVHQQYLKFYQMQTDDK